MKIAFNLYAKPQNILAKEDVLTSNHRFINSLTNLSR